MGRVIQGIPERFGALVILVDHDMSLVSCLLRRRRPCSTSAGSSPPVTTADVLSDEHVIRAYLGTEELGDDQMFGAEEHVTEEPA